MSLRRTQLPVPPNPDSMTYSGGDPVLWQRDAYQWMVQVKQRLEQDSVTNSSPTGQFLVSTYTPVNTMTGTDALSNVVATLISNMTNGGYLTTPRKLA
jgi:hypothetical protein